MFSKDIPIELINLALIAIIATPIVLCVCIVWATNRIVRPMWATRDAVAHAAQSLAHLRNEETQPLKVSPSGARQVSNSAFGR